MSSIYVCYYQQTPKNKYIIQKGLSNPNSKNELNSKQKLTENEQIELQPQSLENQQKIDKQDNTKEGQIEVKTNKNQNEEIIYVKKVNIPLVYNEFCFPITQKLENVLKDVNCQKLKVYIEVGEEKIQKVMSKYNYVIRFLFRVKVFQFLMISACIVGLLNLFVSDIGETQYKIGQFFLGIGLVIFLGAWIGSIFYWNILLKKLTSDLKVQLGRLNCEKMGLQWLIKSNWSGRYIQIIFDAFLFNEQFQKQIDQSQFNSQVDGEDHLFIEKIEYQESEMSQISSCSSSNKEKENAQKNKDNQQFSIDKEKNSISPKSNSSLDSQFKGFSECDVLDEGDIHIEHLKSYNGYQINNKRNYRFQADDFSPQQKYNLKSQEDYVNHFKLDINKLYQQQSPKQEENKDNEQKQEKNF